MTTVEQEVIRDRLSGQNWRDEARAADRMSATAMQTYRTHSERAALRCALGDAAALCDAMAKGIERENRGMRGRVTMKGQSLAYMAKFCAEAIWLMRERITMPDESAAA